MLQKKILIWLFSILCFTANAQNASNEHFEISLITCSPNDEASYTLYGHSSIRVRDTTNLKVDYVFNYGIFDFEKSNFIYRFAKGETDYKLEYFEYERFLVGYQLRGSEVYEQVLNLTHNEKEILWQALILNAQPENRVYRYNFFYDNCSTRPARLIEHIINGRITYEKAPPNETFRDMINYCTRNHPWLTFGCDLVLGCPTDRIATLHESFFLPEHLKDAYDKAWITQPDGTKRPLISTAYILAENTAEDEMDKSFFTPKICSLFFFCIVLVITFIEWRKKIYFRWLDCIIFLIAGIAGCMIFFLCFISVHPSMWPNISIMWLHPLHLVGVILFAVKKLHKVAYCYHFINFVALLLMLFGWIFIPQHLNIAFIPLIFTILIRSGYCLMRKKLNIR